MATRNTPNSTGAGFISMMAGAAYDTLAKLAKFNLDTMKKWLDFFSKSSQQEASIVYNQVASAMDAANNDASATKWDAIGQAVSAGVGFTTLAVNVGGGLLMGDKEKETTLKQTEVLEKNMREAVKNPPKATIEAAPEKKHATEEDLLDRPSKRARSDTGVTVTKVAETKTTEITTGPKISEDVQKMIDDLSSGDPSRLRLDEISLDKNKPSLDLHKQALEHMPAESRQKLSETLQKAKDSIQTSINTNATRVDTFSRRMEALSGALSAGGQAFTGFKKANAQQDGETSQTLAKVIDNLENQWVGTANNASSKADDFARQAMDITNAMTNIRG